MNKLKNAKEIWNKYCFILTTSQKHWGVVVIIMTVIGAICETVGVSIILPLVQVMIDTQKLRQNAIISPVIVKLKLDSDTMLIWAVGIAVILVYLVKNIFLLLLSYVRVKYACKVQRELAIEMINSYMKRGYVFFLDTGTGELLRGVQYSINNTYNSLYAIFKLFAEAVTIFFICAYIMFSDIIMAFCVIILAGVCLTIVVLGCQKWVRKCGEIYHKYTALINQILLQTFQGIKEILVMQRQQYFLDAFKEDYHNQQKGNIGKTVAAESPTYLIEAICVAGLIVAVCIKAIEADDAGTLVPQLATFAMAAFRILPSLGRISNYYNQFVFAIPGIEETYENFKEARSNLQLAVISKENDKDIRNIDTFNNMISVENVTWKYPGVKENVLEDISIDIKKGQSVAFVGKSGAGKTTLADVILGLLIPQNGKIKIDGIDIEDMSNRSALIGFVPQNVYLLDDTVRRNVAFGVSDSEINDELVWKALEQAQLKDIIEKYPKKLNTEIGERGVRFSGGQRQRFAIARALYNDPDILILDEATSALDTETETAVMESIDALQGHKTLIIIAHRLTTIRNCDIIYEVVDGKAVKKNYEDL